MKYFELNLQVSYTNIKSRTDGQELLLKVYAFTFSPERDPGKYAQEL